jgi:hypothetical protein
MSSIAVNAITDASAGNTATINAVTPNTSNVVGKNRIINGNFDFWQRGTTASYSVSSSQYLSDRWHMRTTATANVTTSQQSFTVGQTDVPNNPKYFYRWDITSHTTGSGVLEQRIEDVSTFAGNTCTLSFWAKCSTAQTLSNSYLQVFGTGGSADVTTSGSSFSLTTAWQKFTATFTLPSISGKTIAGGNDYLNIRFNMPNAACAVDISQVQLEAGLSATEFEHRQYGTELSLCQRYYQQPIDAGLDFFPGYSIVGGYGPGCFSTWHCEMRATPTVVVTIGSLNNVTNVGATYFSKQRFMLNPTYTSTGYGFFYINKLTASAEL